MSKELCCNEKDCKNCGCVCHRTTGVLLVVLGVSFLLAALEIVSQKAVSITWPILVILIGFKKTLRGFCKCCSRK